MKASETPVLIVGGGPVGLALAAELGWRGVPCTLIEQSDGRITTPKMNEVNTRTMEFCRRWGIADGVMRCPFPDDYPLDVVFVTTLGGHEIARMKRPPRKDQRPGPFSPMTLQICSQMWFDPMLLELARSFPHVQVRHRTRLDSYEARRDGVLARITEVTSGSEETVYTRYLAGCDGANSAIRRSLGIKMIGSDLLSRPLHLYFRTPDLMGQLGKRQGTFYLAIDRAGIWANVRVIDPVQGLWRLMVLDAPSIDHPSQVDRESYLRRAVGRSLAVDWVGVSIWTRRGVVAERYSDGPVHLLGDAVHQLSPTGALGMNTGIGDAVDLGWKLAALHEGWGGRDLLASYDAERHPVGARNVSMTTGFFQSHGSFAHTMERIEDTTPDGAAFRKELGEKLVRDVARMFRTLGLELGYRYDSSPICVPDDSSSPPDDPERFVPSARPGCRAPHVSLSDDRSTLDLFGKGFVLLRLDESAPDPSPMERAAAEKHVPFSVVTLREPAVREVYAASLVLVRPDGHVAWRANALPADPDHLIDRVRGAI